MIGAIVYGLCALTSAVCALLLLRSYFARPAGVLLWTSVGFIGLFVNNLLLFVDLVAAPQIDLSLVRNLTAAVSLTVLLYGLIWETR